MASKKTRRAREIWGNCIRSNYWPGYPNGVQRVEEQVGVPVNVVGVGAERDDYLLWTA